MKKISTLLLLTIVGALAWATYPTEDNQNSNAKLVGKTTGIHVNGPDALVSPIIKIPKIAKAAHGKNSATFQVHYGDTFNNILKDLKLPSHRVDKITHQLQEYLDPKDFQVGIPYQINYGAKKRQPIQLIFQDNVRKPLIINLETGSVERVDATINSQVRMFSAFISSSLAESIINANVPNDLSDKILSIFAWKLDFSHLSKGDSYRILYEEESIDGEIIGSGHVLAAHFIHDGTTYRGYGFDDGNGFAYFDENGQNLSHAPLHFDLITSLYDRKRLHPVRRTYRPHLGMDFEAQKGTSVIAIKGGVVLEAGYGRANGNFVKIKHDEDLSTQYLHLSVIDSNISIGKEVVQGQKIGEVGTTGLSSGPHLCFRVWYKGRQEDPLEFDFPRRPDISESLLQQFKETVGSYDQTMGEKEFL